MWICSLFLRQVVGYSLTSQMWAGPFTWVAKGDGGPVRERGVAGVSRRCRRVLLLQLGGHWSLMATSKTLGDVYRIH